MTVRRDALQKEKKSLHEDDISLDCLQHNVTSNTAELLQLPPHLPICPPGEAQNYEYYPTYEILPFCWSILLQMLTDVLKTAFCDESYSFIWNNAETKISEMS